MIYTVTVNPSLDYIVRLPRFEIGGINRTCSEKIFPGGKGINVSIVLNNLGIKNKAIAFSAGFIGQAIEENLKLKNVDTDFIHLSEGMSRINVKFRCETETEINGMGPTISSADIDLLLKKLSTLTSHDTLVLAGSIPPALPATFYSAIMKSLLPNKVKIVVDATGETLKSVLEFKPFLIKPNNLELGEIFKKTISSEQDVISCAAEMKKMGARNVLVSMAAKGAILLAEDGNIYKGDAHKGKLVNSVGAGDSMVAGFIAGWQKSFSYDYALKMGLCAGTASACSEELATKNEVEKLLNNYGEILEVSIKKIY